jgi:type II secretory pathway pseudopilin PulG
LSAFSLIELSIVIIILGLLAVGVMGGMGMVRTAKVNGIIREYMNIKTALNSFYIELSRLPGDINRDGRILRDEGGGINENIEFWRELSYYELMGDLYYKPNNDDDSGSNSSNIIIGTTIPASKYDRKAGWYMEYVDSVKMNRLLLVGFDNSNRIPMVSSRDAKNVDIKIDDGKVLEGIVHGVEVNIGEDGCMDDNIDYSIGDDKGKCVLAFYEEGVTSDITEYLSPDEIEKLNGAQPFYYTGGSQEFVVPKGVKELKLEVWGAQGGGTKGGLGGYSYGTLTVTTGKILHVYVGGQGSSVAEGKGGWNGGGDGPTGAIDGGMSGGGGTDIRTSKNNTYNDRVIVAGGGGGTGTYSDKSGHGGGGNSSGGDGNNNSNPVEHSPNNYGRGGTLTAGGDAGTPKSCNGVICTAEAGSFGKGGNGCYNGWAGGAGGGGWYGGGASSGAWGGSGGGGSGYIGGVTNGGGENGIRSGDGIARICWGNKIDVCGNNDQQFE